MQIRLFRCSCQIPPYYGSCLWIGYSASSNCNPLLPQRTLSSLELPRALSHVPSPMCESPTTPDPEKSELDKSSNNFQQNGRRQKNHDPARDISIQVLEKFSLVTRFARETTSQLFRESYQDSFSSKEGWKDAPLSPAYNHEAASNDSPKVPDEVSVAADPVEVINFHFPSHFCF